MKAYDPKRADARPIEEKALGLLFAMTNEEAARLHETLGAMARTLNSDRAKLFLGSQQ